MKPHDATPERCAVCGKTMRLGRTVAAPAKGERYEFWECVACGHTHVRATASVPEKKEPARSTGSSQSK
jgi:Zn ribbon nucleic-acid-binding protein